MKKILGVIVASVLIILGMSENGYSQSLADKTKTVSIHIACGVARSKLIGRTPFPVRGPYDYNKTGLTIGCTVDKMLCSNISVKTGVFYSQLGGNTEKLTGTDDTGTILGEFHSSQCLDYIEIPLLITAGLRLGRVYPMIEAGPNIGIAISGREKFKATYKIDYQYDKDVMSLISKINYGFVFGAGLTCNLASKVSLSLICRYNIVFTNNIKDGSSGQTQKRRDWKILLGPVFEIK